MKCEIYKKPYQSGDNSLSFGEGWGEVYKIKTGR
jgi:hypothetical protein